MSNNGQNGVASAPSRETDSDPFYWSNDAQTTAPSTAPSPAPLPATNSDSDSDSSESTKAKWCKIIWIFLIYVVFILAFMLPLFFLTPECIEKKCPPNQPLNNPSNNPSNNEPPKEPCSEKKCPTTDQRNINHLSTAFTIGTVVAAGLVWLIKQCCSFPDRRKNICFRSDGETTSKRGWFIVFCFVFFITPTVIIIARYEPKGFDELSAATAAGFTIGAIIAAGIVTCVMRWPCSKQCFEDAEQEGLPDPDCCCCL